jgi:hypothetical protein
MPIADTDIKYIVSGGAGNTDPNASLGGARSTAGGGVITTDVLNNVWDHVSGDDSAAGDTEYRCIYIDNQNGTLSLTNPVCWIETNTANANTDITIGLGTSAVDGTEQTVANENTAPSGVTFVAAANKAGGLSLTTLASNQHRAIWIKRVVTAGASASNNDAYTLKTEGETAA